MREEHSNKEHSNSFEDSLKLDVPAGTNNQHSTTVVSQVSTAIYTVRHSSADTNTISPQIPVLQDIACNFIRKNWNHDQVAVDNIDKNDPEGKFILDTLWEHFFDLSTLGI